MVSVTKLWGIFNPFLFTQWTWSECSWFTEVNPICLLALAPKNCIRLSSHIINSTLCFLPVLGLLIFLLHVHKGTCAAYFQLIRTLFVGLMFFAYRAGRVFTDEWQSCIYLKSDFHLIHKYVTFYLCLYGWPHFQFVLFWCFAMPTWCTLFYIILILGHFWAKCFFSTLITTFPVSWTFLLFYFMPEVTELALDTDLSLELTAPLGFAPYLPYSSLCMISDCIAHFCVTALSVALQISTHFSKIRFHSFYNSVWTMES